MVDQFSIAREYTQEVRASENDANFSRRLQRQISVSEPNSEGKKSLIKKYPVWLVSQ